MRYLTSVFFTLSLLSAWNLNVANAKSPKGHFGSTIKAKDGSKLYLTIGLLLSYPSEADPKLYRRVWLDRDPNPIAQGPYPSDALKAGRGGWVSADLQIDESGVVTACEIKSRSGDKSIDQHACPHLLKYGKFLPALDTNGKRVKSNTEVDVHYDIRDNPYLNYSMLDREIHPSVRAKLNKQMTSDEAGIPSKMKFPKYTIIDGFVRINPNGLITACTVRYSTKSDSLDKGICDRLMKSGPHTPARDSRGQATADDIQFEISVRQK